MVTFSLEVSSISSFPQRRSKWYTTFNNILAMLSSFLGPKDSRVRPEGLLAPQLIVTGWNQQRQETAWFSFPEFHLEIHSLITFRGKIYQPSTSGWNHRACVMLGHKLFKDRYSSWCQWPPALSCWLLTAGLLKESLLPTAWEGQGILTTCMYSAIGNRNMWN